MANESRPDSKDIVFVVRCGKCKYFDPDTNYCQFWHGLRKAAHFCREGKRKPK